MMLVSILMITTVLPVSSFAPLGASERIIKRSTIDFSTGQQYATTPSASLPASQASIQQRRKVLLKRNGPFFQFDPSSGEIEFGATINLTTQLDTDGVDGDTTNYDLISAWLSDERRIAKAIWDESLVVEQGNSVYQLQLMTLQFVTLQLQPTVTIKMWTSVRPDGVPVFYLQSLGFEPNLSLLGGGLGKVDAKAFGLVIDVVGQLAPTDPPTLSCETTTQEGGGVRGKIAFSTSGVLSLPLRLVPEGILRKASNSICETVSNFCVQSFQAGARQSYREFQTERGLIPRTLTKMTTQR